MRTLPFIAGVASMVLAFACSSANDEPDASPFDGGFHEASHEAGACNLDGGVQPHGTQLVQSSKAYVVNTTSDDFVVYEDRGSGLLYAVPIAGGKAPDQIGPVGYDYVYGSRTTGKVFSFWINLDASKYPLPGELVTWSSEKGTHSVSAKSLYGVLAFNDDQSLMAYGDNAVFQYPDPEAGPDAGAITGTYDIVVASSDGTNKQTVLSNLPWNASCNVPQVMFVGGALVTSTCTAQSTFLGATLRAHRAPTWTGTVLNNQPAYAGYAFAGKNGIGYYTAGSTLTIQNVATSGPPLGVATNVYPASFMNDDTSVLFLSGSGAIGRASLTNPSPVQVTPGPFIAFAGLSADDKWLLTYDQVDPDTQLYDLYLLPTAANSAPVQLVKTLDAAFPGDFFTRDNRFTMYGANNKAIKLFPGSFVGDLDVLPLTSPSISNVVTITSTDFFGYATHDSQILYTDNFDQSYANQPVSDLKVADLASNKPPELFVSAIDWFYFFNHDRSKVVYSWTRCGNGNAGVWVADVP